MNCFSLAQQANSNTRGITKAGHSSSTQYGTFRHDKNKTDVKSEILVSETKQHGGRYDNKMLSVPNFKCR